MAAGAMAASAAILLFALAFALYAEVAPSVGPAGAAAIVAAAAAAFLALGSAVLFLAGRPRPAKVAPPSIEGVAERALKFLRENPAVTISAALGVGFLAIRNPRYLGAAIRSFVEGRETPKPRR